MFAQPNNFKSWRIEGENKDKRIKINCGTQRDIKYALVI